MTVGRVLRAAAILTSSCLAMARTLIVHFSNKDGTVKIKLPDNVHLDTAQEFMAFLMKYSDKVDSTNFALEFIDSDGKFCAAIDDKVIVWSSNFLSVLLIDLAPRLSSLPVLSIRGRAFDSSHGLSITSKDGSISTIHIKEREEASKGTGLITWDGAIVLAKYLETHPTIVHRKRVLELGAGTGVAGVAAALLGASSVLLTDLEYALDNLRANVVDNLDTFLQEHSSVSVEVSALDWADPTTYQFPRSLSDIEIDIDGVASQHRGEGEREQTRDQQSESESEPEWDAVIGADVVWLEELVPLLVQALSSLCGPHTHLYLSHQMRSERTDALLFSSLDKYFNIEKIPHSEYHPLYDTPKISIMHGRRKAAKEQN